MRNRHSVVLMLLLISTGVLVMLGSGAAVAQTPFPTFTPFVVPTASVTPPPQPTIFPTQILATPAGCPVPLPIVPGAIIMVSSGVLLRYQPDTSAPIITYFGTAREFTVIAGPTCADGYNWWQIDTREGPGWVAEGRPERPPGYFIRLLVLPEESACGTPQDFAIGDTIRLAQGVRVHQDASLNGLVLHVAPFDSLVQVVGGPTCADGYNWWRIQVPYSGVIIEGWIAEGPEGASWLLPSTEPTPACAPPIRRLTVGGVGYGNYHDHRPKNLRDTPAINGAILYTLVDGVGFEVIGGPVCADSYNWWYVRILGRPDVTGWLSEGGPGNYWIRVGEQPPTPSPTPG